MKKQTNRLLSLLLSFVMVIGMLPAVTPHVHAADAESSMTLTSSSGIVTPSEVIETGGAKLKVYDVTTGSNYNLTTSADNDYGVLFRVSYGKDPETENTLYYVNITFNNVTIKTSNPRHNEASAYAAGHYAAVMICRAPDVAQEEYDFSANLHMKGTNTVELLGASNPTASECWSAIDFRNCYRSYIVGSGSGAVLNVKTAYVGAAGEVAGIRSSGILSIGSDYTVEGDSSIPTKDQTGPLEVNVTANAVDGNGTAYGDGIVAENSGIDILDDTDLDITAMGTGILVRNEQVKSHGPVTIKESAVNISAVTAGIAVEGQYEKVSNWVGDYAYKSSQLNIYDSTINVGGIKNGGEVVTPLQSGLNAAGRIWIDNTTATITAVDRGIDAAYDPGGNNSYTHEGGVRVENGSIVTVTANTGAEKDEFSKDIPAVDAESASNIQVNNSTLTVNAGYLALVTQHLYVFHDSEFYATTTNPANSALGCYTMTVYHANYGGDGCKSGKVVIESAAKSLGVGQHRYFYSDDVWIHTAGGAPIGPNTSSNITTLGDGIVLMESADGTNWQPISLGRNSSDEMRYLTTIPQDTHICRNDDPAKWTKVEDKDEHTAACPVCNAVLTKPCEYVYYNYYPKPTETTDGEISYKCSVSQSSHYKDIIVPAHNCADYVSEDQWENYGSTSQHKGTCTYYVEAAGIPCGNAVYAAHNFTDWSGDSLTISRTCTDCGYTESKSTHENVTHMEAVAGDCSKPGRIEYWYCADSDCGLYFADELMTQVVDAEDTTTIPGPHNYVDGTCTVCGDKVKQLTFVPYTEDYYSDNMEGEYFIFVGFKDGQAYAMGNKTNADGFREAVSVTVKSNGAITTDSETAEFFALNWTPLTFCPDGGFMSMLDGKIVVYDKERYDQDTMPDPVRFMFDDYEGNGYFFNWTNDDYIVFDAETLTFKVSDISSDTIVAYKQVCSHENLTHIKGADPTCTEQGALEYWYCDDCYNYYLNGDLEAAAKPEDGGEFSTLDFTLAAYGHKFNDEGVCENCGMKRPVYTLVPSLEAFDQLSDDASYIIVFKDGDKTYAARLPDLTNPCETDSDGDGIVDVMEADTNTNGIPDCIDNYIDTNYAADEDEDGITTAEEYNAVIGDLTEDGIVDGEDYTLFFEYEVFGDLYYYYDELAFAVDNFVEVTMADNGSITLADEGAMEFQMMESGVWGGQSYDEESLEYDKENNGVLETDRLRAAWVPNYWVASGGMMGYYDESHFMTQERWYGDGDQPGITDNKNWKISFNADGTVLLVCSWESFDNTGALQFAKYTNNEANADMTIVGFPEWQWEYSDIMMNRTDLLPAYLYASEPTYAVPPHDCEWGPWVDDDVTDTHTRRCTVAGCNKKQTEEHNWDDGVQSDAPTCTEPGVTLYTCGDCGATYEEEIDNLGHDWSEWTYDSVDSHIRNCKRNCGVEEEFGGHEWGEWTVYDDNTHRMTCSICHGYQEGEHDWDNGVETTSATCYSTGVMTYTCGTCGHTKTEEIPMTDHTWTDWAPDGDESHKRECMNDNCDAAETLPHDWDDGVVTTEPSCAEKGVKTYTCLTCQHTKTEELPKTDHQWSDWSDNKDGTHTRSCCCNATETKDCAWDDGVVTDPTCTEAGETTYTCGDCGAIKTEAGEAALNHDWTDWTDTGDNAVADIHERSCKRDGCDAKEAGNHEWSDWVSTGNAEHKKTCSVCDGIRTDTHNWDNGEVTTPPTENAEGIKTYTCTVETCGATKTEVVAPTSSAKELDTPVVTVTNRASDGKPVIEWEPVEGATGYEVWRCDTKNGEYKRLYTAKADDFDVVHTGAAVGEDYFYKVRAINDDTTGEFSAAKGVWVDLKQPTIKVTNRASDGKPVISWTAVEGATGYAVYRCGTKNGTYVKMYTAPVNDFDVVHTGAAVGNDYFYKVVALYGDNAKCNSAYSAAKGVWVDLKRPTIKVVNSASSGKPVISWGKVDYAVGYKVYCSVGSSTGTYKQIYSTTNPDKLSVTHIGAEAGEAYFYKVVAVHKNAKCTSAYSTVKGVYCDLARPTLTVTLNSSGKPYLSWSEVEGADGYYVYRSTNGKSWTRMFIAPADDFDVNHSGAVAGTTYYYKVIAVCSATKKSNSAYSDVISITAN